mmetsp:Transcript_22660/g.40894  ORF Transcript_22660/g.40894 Transcript_22660/m.40894 type:complete len:101 (-) Transcript_22660:1123-1425(-)
MHEVGEEDGAGLYDGRSVGSDVGGEVTGARVGERLVEGDVVPMTTITTSVALLAGVATAGVVSREKEIPRATAERMAMRQTTRKSARVRVCFHQGRRIVA